jgi:hypothetical protein
MSKHAICSPSGAKGWINCSGWEGSTGSNKYSRHGTAGHELAARCLITGHNAAEELGATITVEGEKITVDQDMIDAVQKYVNMVRELGGNLYVEQKLAIEKITGEPGAEGTSDAVVLFDDEICIADLKMGMGISVYAEENEQLQIYALAALEEFSIVQDFKRARLIIVQPRIHNISEWSLPIEDLKAFGVKVKEAAAKKLSGKGELNPSEDACRWCSRKATCPALATSIANTVGADFDDLSISSPPLKVEGSPEDLARKMNAVGMIEDFCKAIRAEVEAQLLKGNAIPGYKLVRGKQGNRQWASEEEAEAALKKMRLKQEDMYSFRVLSPTAIEKFMKDTPKRWESLQPLITRKEGAISVASEDDRRPAVDVSEVGAGFDNLDKELV